MSEYYPKSFEDFKKRFSTDKNCREYIAILRWPNGVPCPRCYSNEYWLTSKGLYCCKGCKKQYRVTEDTIFYRSHIPLKLWFRAIWYVTEETLGAKASELKEILKLGSYQTAFDLLHKLRKVMVLPIRTRLSGTVVIDIAYVCGAYTDKHDQGGGGKYLVALAIEVKNRRTIRVRIRRLKKLSFNYLTDFILEIVENKSLICIESLTNNTSFDEIKTFLIRIGYNLVVGDDLLSYVNKVSSQLDDWFSFHFQGNINKEYLNSYLNEFTFRFNKQKNFSPGELFYRLIKNAACINLNMIK